jgi:hypothetical protein
VLAQVVPPEGSEEGGNDAEDEEFDPSDTLDVQEDAPLTPDTTRAAQPPPSPADTSGFVPSTMDTTGAADTSAAGIDTLRGTFVPVTPDSATAARRAAAAADSGVGDTLFTAKPGPQAPAPQPPKPRSGILGIHPIVILLGLVALHYFVTKTTGD